MNAQPFPYTHLSLPEYAKIIGINPIHFMGASGSNYWTTAGACEDVWPRHVWQTTMDVVSHEEIVRAIAQAEHELSTVLGYNVAPEWTTQHVINYPKHYNPLSLGYLGADVQGKVKSVTVGTARIISPGRRATTLIEAGATVTYSDPDGDGWNELATITVTTTVTDNKELHVFHAGTTGNPYWEIRPIKSAVISGGTATITFDSWVLIDPDQHGAYPTTGDLTPLDAENAATYVSTVDVYRVYNDLTTASAEFLWQQQSYGGGAIVVCNLCGGVGCSQCALIQQDGCFAVLNANRGVVTPYPATYDASTEVWSRTAWAEARDPDQVRLYFRSGEYSQEYLNGYTLDPLDPDMARTIAWLATARIERNPCSCANVDSLFEQLRKDLTTSTRTAFNVRFSTQDIFRSPFGFRYGEVRAWQSIHSLNRSEEFHGGLL